MTEKSAKQATQRHLSVFITKLLTIRESTSNCLPQMSLNFDDVNNCNRERKFHQIYQTKTVTFLNNVLEAILLQQ